MKYLIALLLLLSVSVTAAAQDCSNGVCTVQRAVLSQRPTLAPVLPAVASTVRTVAAVPVRVVAKAPQVVMQMPVVRHVGHGHMVSILERPVGIVRRVASVPSKVVRRVSHKARFGCR